MKTSDVFSRQTILFNPEQHNKYPVTIIGCGSTGSFAAVALAKMGFSRFRLWDADRVEPHNCPNQLHSQKHIGKFKTEATADMIADNSPLTLASGELEVELFNEFYEGQSPLKGIVVCAVDSMKGRKTVWDKVKGSLKTKLYIDPRMGGESYYLFSLIPSSLDHQELYEQYMYSDDEADEPECGAQSIIDMAFLVASRITYSVRNFLARKIVNTLIIEDVSTGSVQFIDNLGSREER